MFFDRSRFCVFFPDGGADVVTAKTNWGRSERRAHCLHSSSAELIRESYYFSAKDCIARIA